jgi:hypothetical protein
MPILLGHFCTPRSGSGLRIRIHNTTLQLINPWVPGGSVEDKKRAGGQRNPDQKLFLHGFQLVAWNVRLGVVQAAERIVYHAVVLDGPGVQLHVTQVVLALFSYI